MAFQFICVRRRNGIRRKSGTMKSERMKSERMTPHRMNRCCFWNRKNSCRNCCFWNRKSNCRSCWKSCWKKMSGSYRNLHGIRKSNRVNCLKSCCGKRCCVIRRTKCCGKQSSHVIQTQFLRCRGRRQIR